MFMKNGENKTTLFNLIEHIYVKDSTKLQDRVIYFSNEILCRKISADGGFENLCSVNEVKKCMFTSKYEK